MMPKDPQRPTRNELHEIARQILERRGEPPYKLSTDRVMVSKKFLESAMCPVPNCADGKVTDSGPDPVYESCEWCTERDQLLNGEVPLNGFTEEEMWLISDFVSIWRKELVAKPSPEKDDGSLSYEEDARGR